MANSEERSTVTSNRILDAAASCFHHFGLDKTTMSDIIAKSDLARTTVYRHFPTRDDIISQLVLRDIDYLIQHLDTFRTAHKEIESQLLEILVFTIDELVKRPVLAELVSQDPARLSKLGLSNEIVMAYTQKSTKPTYDMIEAAGRLRGGVSLEEFSDWCGRITMSLVMNPYRHQDNPTAMRRYIKNFVVPALLSDSRKSDSN